MIEILRRNIDKNTAWVHSIILVTIGLFYCANYLISDNNSAAILIFLLVSLLTGIAIIGEIYVLSSKEMKQKLIAALLILLNLAIGAYALFAAVFLDS